MISRLLHTLTQGLHIMRSNGRMILVAVLVFVFPLLFVWMTQIFFTTAHNNINTAQAERVGILHDAIAATLQYTSDEAVTQSVITAVATDNPDITLLRVYREVSDGFEVLAAVDDTLLGTIDPDAAPISDIGFSTGLLASQRFEYIVDGKRIWYVVRRVAVENEYRYIYSVHDFSRFDAELAYRKQQSYQALSVIFIFIIALAYWLHRQTDWQREHAVLTERSRERDLFANMIAHEFRAPLTAIKGYASFLQQAKSLTAEERRFADIIRQSTERLVLLVNDFLEVARLQSGQLKVKKVDTDIRTVLTATVDDLQTLAAEKGLALMLEPNKKPVMLTTDSARLQQILINLTTNAIKYTEKGSVTLQCAEERRKVVIRVMDTGMGISAEDQQKLFTPFTRVGGVDESNITGTGLGMYITKELIALLGGTVGVESIKGVGSHIVVTFPAE